MPTPKQRLLTALQGQPNDRPPVICTGGMMNAAIVEVMNNSGHTLPAAHTDAEKMAALAAAIHQHTGFENIGIPFCMTVEAEVLGSEVSYGTLECEPKVCRERFAAVRDVQLRTTEQMLADGRIQTIVSAAALLAERYPAIPLIGNLTGPVSTAASLVDPVGLLKDFRKQPQQCHQLLEQVCDLLIGFARRMAAAGVNAISIGDPTATGEILGPRVFEEFALRYLNRVIDALHEDNIPVIVHICGNMNVVRQKLPELHADAISTDAMVNLKQLKADYPSITTMGNLSTYLLELGSAEQVAAQTRRLLQDGIDILSPACGLSTSTSLRQIRAMTDAVREA